MVWAERGVNAAVIFVMLLLLHHIGFAFYL